MEINSVFVKTMTDHYSSSRIEILERHTNDGRERGGGSHGQCGAGQDDRDLCVITGAAMSDSVSPAHLCLPPYESMYSASVL